MLLEGPSGSGKTTLVSTLAELQQQELMVVYLGEQIDSKVRSCHQSALVSTLFLRDMYCEPFSKYFSL